MDRGPWWATVRGVTKNRTQLSDYHSSPYEAMIGEMSMERRRKLNVNCFSVAERRTGRR